MAEISFLAHPGQELKPGDEPAGMDVVLSCDFPDPSIVRKGWNKQWSVLADKGGDVRDHGVRDAAVLQ